MSYYRYKMKLLGVKFMNQKLKKWKIFGYCFLISALFLLFASKSSPLYVMNDWVDANAFFTVGKGMVHGMVPYRDLFEQKGPLLFLIHAIAYLISPTTFFGVYVMEVLSFTIFLYYIYKLAILYLKKEHVILLLPILSALILATPSFRMGDSAEEFVFPFLSYSLYTFFAYFKGAKKLNDWDFILNGFIAGCVLWIKYTMIGFWFAWMMCFFFEYIRKKEYLKSFSNCFSFLLGMGLATLPWLLYFGIHHALYDFFDVYFLINLNSYSKHISILDKLTIPFRLFYENLRNYPLVFWFFLLGTTGVFLTTKIMSKKYEKLFFFFLFFIGKNFDFTFSYFHMFGFGNGNFKIMKIKGIVGLRNFAELDNDKTAQLNGVIVFRIFFDAEKFKKFFQIDVADNVEFSFGNALEIFDDFVVFVPYIAYEFFENVFKRCDTLCAAEFVYDYRHMSFCFLELSEQDVYFHKGRCVKDI